jgi:tRNA pseudouridine38-40 synthase
LDAAVEKITGQSTRTLASGRTDAGVHAFGQVVSVRTESHLAVDVWQRALNAVLPRDISVLDVTEVGQDFHPIRDVVRKRYRYVIHDGPVRDVFQRRYAWHYTYGRLDAEAMQRAALPLLGTHDFSSFESSGAERLTSIRTIFAFEIVRQASPQEDFITLEVEADGFLYNMVRALVGTLVLVGNGSRPENWPGEALAAKDRSRGGATAPPQGLFLLRVEYQAETP